jgi:hypothetical protein
MKITNANAEKIAAALSSVNGRWQEIYTNNADRPSWKQQSRWHFRNGAEIAEAVAEEVGDRFRVVLFDPESGDLIDVKGGA